MYISLYRVIILKGVSVYDMWLTKVTVRTVTGMNLSITMLWYFSVTYFQSI